jgi:trimeric autotransporter adhesin
MLWRHALRGVSPCPSRIVCAIAAIVPPVAAQCGLQWQAGAGAPGTDGSVFASTMWDPDGSGPLQPVLVVGGDFETAGGIVARRIAACDVSTGTWFALGPGVNGDVHALVTLPNGDLVAGGSFTGAGGPGANYIARWNGTSWSAFGSSTSGPVNALATLLNGDLVAARWFTSAGGVPANGIARWNGSAWSALGPAPAPWGSHSPSVTAMATLPNGDLIVGGSYVIQGGHQPTYVPMLLRWNGTAWSAVVSNPAWISSLAGMSNGDLIVGGSFSAIGGVPANNIARWDGANWSAFGSGTNLEVSTLLPLSNGNFVAGGRFTTAGGAPANRVAHWNGLAWSPLGSGATGLYSSPKVNTLVALPNGDLVAAGEFPTIGGVGATNVARWNGAVWSALATGFNDVLLALAPLPNGDVVAGGYFTCVGVVNADYIARWDGANWSPLGSGMNGGVLKVEVLPNGHVVAGGHFTVAGGVSANHIARWDGIAWSALGAGSNVPVNALATLPNGDVVAGGQFNIPGSVAPQHVARWDGATWSAFGTGPPNGAGALATLPNGDVLIGGAGVSRWNGTTWSNLGLGPPDIQTLAVLPNGDIVVGGWFPGVRRWNGTSWFGLGSGPSGHVTALAALPNGSVVAGGSFPNHAARWDGAAWSSLASGTNGAPAAFTLRRNGELVVGGSFTWVGAVSSAYFARLASTCPATAAASGAGCSGSGGPDVLTATALPWVGSTFRSVATGMPTNGLVVGVRGLAAVSIPLATVIPQALPGCALMVSSDVLDVFAPVAGSVSTQMAIPNAIALIARVFHEQVVALELAAAGDILSVTSTNALTMTIGAL